MTSATLGPMEAIFRDCGVTPRDHLDAERLRLAFEVGRRIGETNTETLRASLVRMERRNRVLEERMQSIRDITR